MFLPNLTEYELWRNQTFICICINILQRNVKLTINKFGKTIAVIGFFLLWLGFHTFPRQNPPLFSVPAARAAGWHTRLSRVPRLRPLCGLIWG